MVLINAGATPVVLSSTCKISKSHHQVCMFTFNQLRAPTNRSILIFIQSAKWSAVAYSSYLLSHLQHFIQKEICLSSIAGNYRNSHEKKQYRLSTNDIVRILSLRNRGRWNFHYVETLCYLRIVQ